MSITTHIHQIYIHVPAAKVWAAITDPEQSAHFFDQSRFVAPPKTGAPYRMINTAQEVTAEGMIEELVPPGDNRPGQLTQTFALIADAQLREELPSRIEWTVDPVAPEVTCVTLRHLDLAQAPLTWEVTAHSWPWIISELKSFCENGQHLPVVSQLRTTNPDDGQWHRRQGITANNAVRPLIEQHTGDSPLNDGLRILDTAHAAAYHWAQAVGSGPVNIARGAYMVAAAHLAVHSGEIAHRYAQHCLNICTENGFKDFDLAYAHEVMARSAAMLGDLSTAKIHWQNACGVPIEDPEDRAIVHQDLAQLPVDPEGNSITV